MTTSSWQQTDADNNVMPIHFSIPAGAGPFPALVVIQHQTGVDGFIQGIDERLAAAGFVAAAPNLYHRDGADCADDMRTRSQRLSDRRVIADAGAAVKFLANHGAVEPSRLGVIGFCMGGRIAYLLAAANAQFKAAVAFYPGNTGRAWGRDTPSPFERTAEIHCPILGHFGDDDKNPSPEDRLKLAGELTTHNKIHELYSYPGAGHGFMDHTKASHCASAAAFAWPRTIDFLHRHLNARAS